METRQHKRTVTLAATPERTFAALHTPSDIQGWWGAQRAIVVPRTDGTWAAAWGTNEDAPDYVTAARMRVFEPPRRIVMVDFQYVAAAPLPFEAEFETEFLVEPHGAGSRLTVTQAGFPVDPVADAFYAGCEKGWTDTLDAFVAWLDVPR